MVYGLRSSELHFVSFLFYNQSAPSYDVKTLTAFLRKACIKKIKVRNIGRATGKTEIEVNVKHLTFTEGQQDCSGFHDGSIITEISGIWESMSDVIF